MGYDPIFNCTDSDGDELELRQWIHPDGAGRLIAEITSYDSPNHGSEVRLDRAQVVALWSALNQWLCDDSPTTLTQVHLTEEGVREIVRRELTSRPMPPGTPAVAPAPQAGEDVWGEAHPCTACGHAEGVHTLLHGCGAVNGEDECWCTSYRQVAPLAGPDCTVCDHPDIDHSPSVGCRRGGCGCAQYTSAPAPECFCTHAYLRVHSSEGCTYRKCPCTSTKDAS